MAAGDARSVDAYVEHILRAHFLSREELIRSLEEAQADYDENGGLDWEEVHARMSKNLGLDD